MKQPQKALLIVESPTKAQTIRRLLNDEKYEVIASNGHIRDLPEKEKGLSIQKSEEGYTFTPKYVLLPGKEKIVQQIQGELKKAKEVWLATDEDREGEAIAWHLCQTLNIDPHQSVRITFHEITRKALLHALKHPRPINQDLVNAQQARRILDRIVGYEISPLLWRVFSHERKQSALSAGRVQSVALRLIVERERAIANFHPTAKPAAEVLLQTHPPFKATLIQPELVSLSQALSLLEKLRGKSLRVAKLEKKLRRRGPLPPFITSTLQQEALRRLGFSLQRTMRAAQNLYEKGLITYMRTDSTHLAPEALEAIHAAIRGRYGEEAIQSRKWEEKKVRHAQEAHEAIRPTDPSVEEAGESPDEQRLYKLIWQRTLACQMQDALYEETQVILTSSSADIEPLQFEAKGRILTRPGFLQLYGHTEDQEEEADLPLLHIGQELSWKEVRIWEKFSSPPPRYTEGSLVRELEERGIGRPSTYAPILETLFKRDYIKREQVRMDRPSYQEIILYPSGKTEKNRHFPPPELQKNKLVPTALGMRVVDFLIAHFSDIMDYEFTARVEAELDQIAGSELDWQTMLSKFYTHFTAELTQAQKAKDGFQHRLIGYDPVSGKPVSFHTGRNGVFLALGEKGDPLYRTVSVPTSLAPEAITLEKALYLLSFPRTIGTYEESPITLHYGPYGYYIKHKEKNYALLTGMSPFSLSLEEAIQIIQAKKESSRQSQLIRSFPEAQIEILQGRFGPYIRYPGGICSLTKGINPLTLTAEECQKIITSQQARKRKKPTPSKSLKRKR
ncbi:MAG: type I DNA topoisomerase [Bacteroidia bacterium]|nr:type I DNA topoisomerase [Bacteroidia bacterium]MDW8133881.1 type I DNA topoisomerase [Bacteroidia bacterium]